MDLEQRNEAMNSLLSRVSILAYADKALEEGHESLARSSIQYVAAELLMIACQSAVIDSEHLIEDLSMSLDERYDELDPSCMSNAQFIEGVKDTIEDCNAAHKKQQSENEGE